MVHRRTGGEKDGNGHSESRRLNGISHGKPAEEQRHDKSDFCREAWIVCLAAVIGNRYQPKQPCRSQTQECGAANVHGDCAKQRRDCKGTNAGSGSRRSLALATLAFRPDEKADAERNSQSGVWMIEAQHAHQLYDKQ